MPKKRANNGNEKEDDGPPDKKERKHEQGGQNALSSSNAASPRSLRSSLERGRASNSPSCIIQNQPTTSSQTPQPGSSKPSTRPPPKPADNPFKFKDIKILPDSADDEREFEKKASPDQLRAIIIRTPLENDKDWPYGSYINEPRLVCTLAVQVGTADDPEKTPGMARIIERLYAGARHPLVKTNFAELEDPSASVTFNGETHEDVTIYTCVIKEGVDDNKETIKEKIANQFKRFNVNCGEAAAYPDEDIKAEIERIFQEYETYRGKGWLRFEELSRTFNDKKIPNRNFLWGDRSTLQAQKWDDFKADMTEFIKKRYTVKKSIMVLQSVGLRNCGVDMGHLQEFFLAADKELTILKPQAKSASGKGASSSQQQTAQQVTTATQQCAAAPTYPSFLNGTNFNQVYYVQPAAYEDKICLSWCIDYDKDEKKHSEVKPLLYVEALLKSTTPGSLIENLIKRQLITSLDTMIFPRCPPERLENIPVSAIWPLKNKAHLFTIVLSLTREGAKNAYDVIATVIHYIRKLEAKKETYETIQRLRKGRIRAFGAVRRPEESSVKIAYSVLFPQAWNLNILTDDVCLHGYDEAEIKRVLEILKSQAQLNVVIMAHLRDEDEIWKSLAMEDFKSPDNINLGFQYGRKAVDASEKVKWYDSSDSTLRMPTPDELYDDNEKGEWEKVCQQNCKLLLLLGGQRPEEADSDILESDTDKDEGRLMSIRLDHFYIAQSIVNVQIWQPEYLVHNELSGGYSKKPLPRALWLLLGEMIRIKSQLGGLTLTLANRECSVLSVEVDRLSGLNISIHGLHTWALIWFNSLFDWLSNLKAEFENLKATIFDSAKSKLEADIHNPARLCEDLTLRGILLGHDPLIECYDLLLHLEKSNELFTYLETFLAEMKVTVHVRTNVPSAWGDISIKNKFRGLPKYKPKKPQLVKKTAGSQPAGASTSAAAEPQPVPMSEDSFYSMSNLKTYYMALMASPNPPTNLCSVRKTYQIKPDKADQEPLKTLNAVLGVLRTDVWKEFAYGSAPLTHMPQVGLDLSDPDLPCLFIQITSDRRHVTPSAISKKIDDLLVKIGNDITAHPDIYDEGVKKHFNFQQLLKPADLTDDSNTDFRLYEVQVDGQAVINSEKGNAYLPVPDYSSLKRYQPGPGTYSPDEQISHLTAGGRGENLNEKLGNDIRKGIRPARK